MGKIALKCPEESGGCGIWVELDDDDTEVTCPECNESWGVAIKGEAKKKSKQKDQKKATEQKSKEKEEVVEKNDNNGINFDSLPAYIKNGSEYKHAVRGKKGNPYRRGSDGYKIFNLFKKGDHNRQAVIDKLGGKLKTKSVKQRVNDTVLFCTKVGLLGVDDDGIVHVNE